MPPQAKAFALYSDFFKKKGYHEQAREKLQTAIDLFRQCGADGWVANTRRSWRGYSGSQALQVQRAMLGEPTRSLNTDRK